MKKQAVIDFSLFKDKKQCHTVIKDAVGDYDGANLDALFDHLTSTFEPKAYKLVNTASVPKALPPSRPPSVVPNRWQVR